VLARTRDGEFEAVLASHLITTFHYVMAKFSGRPTADAAVDGLLADFQVAGADKALLTRARELPLNDFEDAVVAAAAEAAGCQYIVTRNGPDFADSPVPAITPTEFFRLLPAPPASSDAPSA
jgi:predicted nucleic acid-binding protein